MYIYIYTYMYVHVISLRFSGDHNWVIFIGYVLQKFAHGSCVVI